MEKLNNVVRFEGENGEVIDMAILKEFNYNKKDYVVLMGIDSCDIDDECGCECREGDECGCNDCDCETSVCVVEKLKDKDGNEIFKPIDDEKEYEKIVEQADKLLFDED